MDQGSILIWNLQGLNGQSHHDTVHGLVVAERPSVVCLQEGKLHVIPPYDVMQCLSKGFDYYFLLANRTRGSILVAWCTDVWSVSSTSSWAFLVSTKLTPVAGGEQWWLTSVYGPATEELKPDFLVELHDPRQVQDGP
jgi:hypothetical protein